MKYNIALKWAEDLRKNYKKKATGELKEADREKYCCLGRLCLVLGHEFDGDGYVLSKNGRRYKDDNGFQNSVLPRAIMREAGMKTRTGRIPSIDVELTDLNDTDRKGFKYIATMVEKHWREL